MPVCDITNLERAFHQKSKKLKILRPFSVNNKDYMETKIGYFAFLGRKQS